MTTDAFVDGRSLIDGRSIEEGRTAPPPPLRGYDLWFKPPIRGPVNPLLMTPWLAALAALAVFVLVIVPVPVAAVRTIFFVVRRPAWRGSE